MQDDVSQALLKAADWLASRQKQDGSWPHDSQIFSEPEDLGAELVVTSQCAHVLLLAGNGAHFSALQRGIDYCAAHPLEKGDPTSWYVWKLMAVRLSDSASNARQTSILSRALAQRQDRQGFWPSFPTTLNATNCMAAESVSGIRQDVASKAAVWFKRSHTKGNDGWGHDASSKRSEVPSTAYVASALVMCGEPADSPLLQKARAFLEKTQKADGSWISQRLKMTSVYVTARATLALMLLSKNPFNPSVEKAIKFLIKMQSKTGGWPCAQGKAPQFYVTYHCCLALYFWQHLNAQFNRPDVKQLRELLGTQAAVSWLYRNFLFHLEDRYERTLLRSMLSTKALGSTKDAIMRRNDVLRVLSEGGPGDTAEVIDRLKLIPQYENLSKKSHITQIKADLDYLTEINLVGLSKGSYSLVRDLLRG